MRQCTCRPRHSKASCHVASPTLLDWCNSYGFVLASLARQQLEQNTEVAWLVRSTAHASLHVDQLSASQLSQVAGAKLLNTNTSSAHHETRSDVSLPFTDGLQVNSTQLSSSSILNVPRVADNS